MNRIRSRVQKQAGPERGDRAANDEKTAALHAGLSFAMERTFRIIWARDE